MAELHVVSALRNKRAELAGTVRQLEQQLAQQVTNLAHLDATMQLFDPDIRPQEIRPKQQRARSTARLLDPAANPNLNMAEDLYRVLEDYFAAHIADHAVPSNNPTVFN